eukprot:GHVU01053513.1.p1 GENE.GHVU01053513.1~~GHVU01053513.1.p1  ORF type:complete len:241 (-),score=26.66 GHVU01053513.1:713-1435(-)
MFHAASGDTPVPIRIHPPQEYVSKAEALGIEKTVGRYRFDKSKELKSELDTLLAIYRESKQEIAELRGKVKNVDTLLWDSPTKKILKREAEAVLKWLEEAYSSKAAASGKERADFPSSLKMDSAEEYVCECRRAVTVAACSSVARARSLCEREVRADTRRFSRQSAAEENEIAANERVTCGVAAVVRRHRWAHRTRLAANYRRGSEAACRPASAACERVAASESSRSPLRRLYGGSLTDE